MPRNVCAWVKGIYEVAKAHKMRRVVGVVEGDCSNTRAIMERWQADGLDVIRFVYPYDRSRKRMREEIGRFAERLGARWDRVMAVKKKLDGIREKVRIVDRLTWDEGVVTGKENHLWQVSCSDFWGNPVQFNRALDLFLETVERRKRRTGEIRIGYAGVPPIVTKLYPELEKLGFDVVYNEIQRQFSMPFQTDDIVDQYLRYTYPYDISARLSDIRKETGKRSIRGLVHYVQSFCHRGIEDYLVRREVGVPVLTLESDKPGLLDERSRIRLEAFAEMLGSSEA
jgi:benzoyl-CoA reductase/2-hydroxyglutaryl-CoA dehydratase subunit BcrC/BadD/HgdB